MTEPVEPAIPQSPKPMPEGSNGVLSAGAVPAVCAGAVVALAFALLLAQTIGAGLRPVGQTGALYLLVLVVVAFAARGRPPPFGRSGLANWVTLGRGALICGLAGLIGSGRGFEWLAASLGFAAFLLDGLDGWVARRTGTSSDFGALFDRELDALFVLVLTLLVADLRDVGHWVLLAGGLRYAFVSARAVWPWLAAELPPSGRRRALFGVQVLLLLACLVPLLGSGSATALAAAAVAVVGASFLIDVAWLYRLSVEEPPPCGGRRMREEPRS